jgi:hypothetical protein
MNRRETADLEVPEATASTLMADGLQPCWVSAGGQFGEHPFQGELIQQLGRGERLIGRHWNLTGPVGGADSGAADPHPTAAEGHLAGLAAMAHRRPIRVVAALGADQPGDVLLEHDLQHFSTCRPVPPPVRAGSGGRRRQARQQQR